MKKQIISILIISLFPLAVFSQSVFFEKGEVILKNGQIQTGFLEKNSKRKMEQEINFKPDLYAEEILYTAEDIISYRFTDYNEEYRLVEVDIRKGNGENSKWIKKQKFSRVLTDGDITLIRVHLSKREYDSRVVGSKGYFYILFKDGERYQIDQQDPVLQASLWQVSMSFRAKLRFLFGGCEQAEGITLKMKFLDTEFIKLIEAYQACHNSDVSYFELKASPNTVYNDQLGVSFISVDSDEVSLNRSFSIVYGGEYRFPGITRKMGLSFTAEMAFLNYQYENIPVRMTWIRQKLLLNRYLKESPGFALQLGVGTNWQYPVVFLSEVPDPPSQILLDITTKVRVKKTTVSFSLEMGRVPQASIYLLQQIRTSQKSRKRLIKDNQ